MSRLSFVETVDAVRQIRKAYDDPGLAARLVPMIRRANDAAELLTDGALWPLVARAKVPESERARFAPVVLAFPKAPQIQAGARTFSFGQWLRDALYGDVSLVDLPLRAVRFRRLLAVPDGDPEALVHQIRRLVGHAYQSLQRPVDWGLIGAGMLFWNDHTRRSWAEGFYTKEASHG